MITCEKCPGNYYKDGRCMDEARYVRIASGDDCCRYHEDAMEVGLVSSDLNTRVKQGDSQPVQNAEAVGKYIAGKYWDGLHDHPQASHCRHNGQFAWA